MKPLLLLLTLFMFTAVAHAGRGPDMVIYNGALQSGWQNYGWATINVANPSPVDSGTASISVEATGSNYKALYLAHAPMSTAPYGYVDFLIYPVTSGTAQLRVIPLINKKAQQGILLSYSPAQANQWQTVRISLADLGVANKSDLTGFWFQNASDTALKFYLDAISLGGIDEPNPVRLSVDASRPIRTVDPRLFGINLAIWDSQLSQPSTADALKAMNTQIVRIPGGSASDDYNWQTGRSVTKDRSSMNNAATFARVAEARHAQAFVTVNYGSGTPEQAAAWVAYYNASPDSTAPLGTDVLNRDWKTAGWWAALRTTTPLPTDDGFNFLRMSHPAPFGFRYWEIGNECYGDWEYDAHGAPGSKLTGAPHDPVTYAMAFADFEKQMHAVDPSIRVGAVLASGEDSFGNHATPVRNKNGSRHKGWTPALLTTFSKEGIAPQFLVDHIYPQNAGAESDAFLLQSATKIQSDAADIRKMIGDYLGASGTGIELTLTELNSVSEKPGKQSTSLVDALFCADAIGTVAGTEFNSAVWWDLRNGAGRGGDDNPLLYGWRDYGDYGFLPPNRIAGAYPTFYATKLLAACFHPGDTVLSTGSPCPLLSIYAVRGANGELRLMVINKDPANDLPAEIKCAGFNPGDGSVQTLTYGKPNDSSSADISNGSASNLADTIHYTFPGYSITVLTLKGAQPGSAH